MNMSVFLVTDMERYGSLLEISSVCDHDLLYPFIVLETY